jgi:ATP-dependent DNA helicase RecG
MNLDTPITYLKGAGPQRAKILETKGIATVEDLLYYMPFRYEDRSNIKRIADLAPGETATVVGKITGVQLFQPLRSRLRLFEIRVSDGSGRPLVCKWFRGDYLRSILERGLEVSFFGKVEWDSYSREVSMLHPEYEILRGEEDPDAKLHLGRIVPIYQAIGKLNTRVLRGLVHRALESFPEEPDPLPAVVRSRLGLPDRGRALRDAHFPPSGVDLRLLEAFRTPAQFRLIVEEFFFLECGLALKRRKARSAEGIAFELNDRVRQKIKRILPFKPTGAQKRVLKEIADDMKQPTPMNRLLQGDVGSGKTIVAVEAAVIALENDYQVAVMAPTEILATQHFLYFKRLLEKKGGYVVVGLTGSYSAREKTKLKQMIREGVAHVVVGTHALLSKDVDFRNLGLIVIDEQHRFGVMQRLELLRKGKHPDVLVMTATPIPRTLSLTLYGELDVSIIDQLPPGRSPIKTRHVQEEQSEKVYSFVRRQAEAGRQTYVVYPVIEESETKTVKAAEKMYEHLSKTVFPDLPVSLLHGRLPTAEKEGVMERFVRGEILILVSTTVVEVGVDVPNATVMVIEHAENFGLSQLHQLRGRVGRGREQSYCILLTGELNEIAKERINTMARTQDGFEIAETDLRLRGPGEFFGTKQSGLPEFRVANLIRDREALEIARSEATAFVEAPPSAGELKTLIDYIRQKWQRRYGLVQVG